MIFQCPEARFVVGYTGVAQYGRFDTRLWLLEQLKTCGPPDYDLRGIVDRLLGRANQDLLVIPPAHRALTIMFSGFRYAKDDPATAIPSSILVTNFQDFVSGKDDDQVWEQFRCFPRQADPDCANPCDFQRIGSFLGLDAYEREALERLRGGGNADIMTEWLVNVVRQVAADPRNRGVIGSNVMAVTIPAQPHQPASTGFFSATAGHSYFLPDIVNVAPGQTYIARDLEFAAVDPTAAPPVVVGPQPRKHPCACGSGKRYKHCHGRR